MALKTLGLDALQWVFLALSFVALLRLVLGPQGVDRLIALNVVSGFVLANLVIRGLQEERAIFLDVALVYDIFGFMGLLAIATFLRDRPRDGTSPE